MKRRIVPILCALFLSVAASNGAYAMTKSELKDQLQGIRATVNGTDKKLNQAQLQKANRFLDECGDLTSDQYDAIYLAALNVVTLVSQKSSQGMSLEQMNEDADVIANVTEIISNLRESIPDLHIELENGNAFCGSVALGNAKLTVDLSDIKAAANTSSNLGITKRTFDSTNAANKAASTSTSSPKSKSSKKVVKATGADMDLSVLYLASTASLLGIAAGVLAARKKRLFEGK